MNIWLIQTGESLPLNGNTSKMRTALLADKLTRRGHKVLWWASAFDHFKKEWIFKKDIEVTIHGDLTIIALKGLGYKRNMSVFRFIDHRVIALKFKKIALRMTRPDIIVTSMPPHDLAHEAVMFAKEHNVPVIVDIRDEWPDLFLNFVPAYLKRFVRMLLFKEFKMIKQIMSKADVLISMMNTLLEWGLNYAGRRRDTNDRVFYLGGERYVDANNEPQEKMEFLNKIKNKFIVVFIGTFVQNNNPTILIDCAEKLAGHDIHFILAGDGELFNGIKDRIKFQPNVTLTGWLNQAEINILLKQSHIGVCPASLLRNAFPNKTFTYLSAGIPVISAFQGDLKELLEKYKIGFYYPPNDVDALINCIQKVYNDRMLYEEMRQNAQRIFEELFNADKIYTEYAQHIESIVQDIKLKGNKR